MFVASGRTALLQASTVVTSAMAWSLTAAARRPRESERDGLGRVFCSYSGLMHISTSDSAAIEKLEESVEAFDKASAQASRTLIRLTRALLGLTIAIVILTVVIVVVAFLD